ncbi:hypothetical protein H5410_011801 [Solanum commersonii]|uniref:Uncharacterized protein n=1 Tax=Solanum commersonii TaxID=4109 RepID=A0A9J6AR47_SOLCO|nr:hypothetical protein H5410_011801 [Solanum commersonii]
MERISANRATAIHLQPLVNTFNMEAMFTFSPSITIIGIGANLDIEAVAAATWRRWFSSRKTRHETQIKQRTDGKMRDTPTKKIKIIS